MASESTTLSGNEVLRTRMGVLTYLAPREPKVTPAVVDALEQAAQECMASREFKIVVDLGAVQSISSKLLEAILGIQDLVVRQGGWVKLAHVNNLILDILRVTGVLRMVSLMEQDTAGGGPEPIRAHGGSKRLGDVLVGRGMLTEEQVGLAIQVQQATGRKMGEVVLEKGWVSEAELLEALSDQLDIPFCRLRAGLYDPDVAVKLSQGIAKRLKVFPMFLVRGELTLGTNQPQAMAAFEEIEDRLQCRVRAVLTPFEDIQRCIGEAYAGTGGDLISELIADVDDDFEVMENIVPDEYAVIDGSSADSPIINLVNSIIQRAVHDGASDVHIEPARKKSRVRFRIDGVLYEVMTPRPELHPAIVSRLKVMANLDIAERRLPQDGRIQVHTQGRMVDLRFSSLPGLFGEKIVLRVLDKNQAILDIEKLGMRKNNLNTYKKLLDRSYGLILVTGPTGSGKTTSLYAALNHLNSIEKNIVTIEDPVEYQIDIINQNEVRANIGLTFAKILKHVLRQDPDVVMVGEIRERETAEIAVQAALTGHLVLSTLHTNDSIGAVTRLIDMGVEPYLLSSALIGVIAQRLVRTICPTCRTTYIAPAEIIEQYGWQDRGKVMLARGRGCEECYDSGYRGRLGIHEILVSNPSFQQLVMANASRDELTRYVDEQDITTLFKDGLTQVLDGRTTPEEISRVINM